MPPPPRVVPIFQPKVYGMERFAQDSTLFHLKPSIYRRTVTLDSSARFISIREAIDQTEFYLPAVLDLDTYVKMRLAFDLREQWKASLIKLFRNKVERSSGAIQLDIPLRFKSKTFTRIFGSDRIGLRVTGNISFDLSGRTEKRSGSAVTALESRNTFSPRFKQTQQFTVEGKIGDKVTVSVEQNSEATVDIENTLKLRYDGDEDEIVQKIEAGNISLSLPSTKYVIFGGSNKGLFGLKSQLQMGDLYFTAIASLEKGQQQELSISGGSSESKTTIKDYDFIKNRYFFADMFYHDRFEDGLKDDPQTFAYVAGTEILQLEVWISANISDNDAQRGVAVLNPYDYLDENLEYKNIDLDTIETRTGKVETGYFKPLNYGTDYTFDKYRGFIVLNQAVENNAVLAIAYATANMLADPNTPAVGTLRETLADSNQAVVLKLIKPRAMNPTDEYKETWPLMMRNVYSLGGTNIQKEGFELRLENNIKGDHATYPAGSDRSYLNLLELDLLDANGEPIEGGDEKIDPNPYIIDFANGILIFPALQPFDPPEGSRFHGRLPESDLVKIYNVANPDTRAMLDNHKFDMIVTSKSTKSTFDLGFYVLEGSEVITLGGKT
ncbi:MAG TPA: cell surface protein SprA, partial [Caldithrix abyssi]|nr:cell surface protein SprA [Caldithrix abyssi]